MMLVVIDDQRDGHEEVTVFGRAIAFALRQSESGTPVEEICQKLGVPQATFYGWKKMFAGMGVSEVRHLRQMEEKNRKLTKLVADLSLDKHMLQEIIPESSEAGSQV